jgi:divalent metal cation (Fe/Co/Zn/Cd) transporter
MSLIINSKNPKENEYQYRGARMTDFIAPAILLFFVLVVLLTPLVYFSSLNVSARILSALVTILVSLLIYYVALPYAKKSILLLLNGDTDEIVETKKFEVKIDKHYNGTQLKPYFSKD